LSLIAVTATSHLGDSVLPRRASAFKGFNREILTGRHFQRAV
jgi:hypothetical protein